METIFVEMASYRDAECCATIAELLAKAVHPERIFIGLCLQYRWPQDRPHFKKPLYHAQVRCRAFDAEKSLGVGWARSEARTLWQGEDYILSIDSHMRFVPGWDTALIETLKKCPAPKPVLSTYPAPYVPPNRMRPMTPHICAQGFTGNPPTLRLAGRHVATDFPKRGAFIAGGFSFSSAAVVGEIDHDPYIYFTGEEIARSVRYWSWGWDVFTPHRCLLYHYYTRPKRIRPWEDNRLGDALDRLGIVRVNQLLGISRCNIPEAVAGIDDRHGLGTVRSLAAFERFSGIHFKSQSVSRRSLRGDFSS